MPFSHLLGNAEKGIRTKMFWQIKAPTKKGAGLFSEDSRELLREGHLVHRHVRACNKRCDDAECEEGCSEVPG